jgi:hypothetical protein
MIVRKCCAQLIATVHSSQSADFNREACPATIQPKQKEAADPAASSCMQPNENRERLEAPAALVKTIKPSAGALHEGHSGRTAVAF